MNALLLAMSGLWFAALGCLLAVEPDRVFLFCRVFIATARGLLAIVI